MISKKFLTSSIIYTVSSTFSTVASFLLLPFYTDTHLLKVGDFGALSLYIGLSLFVQIFAGLSFDYYIAKVYHSSQDDPATLKNKIASLNGYLIFAGFFITSLFLLFGKLYIKSLINNPHPAAFRYVIMAVLTGVFNGHFKFYNSLLINREKPWRYLWANILNLVTTVGFSVLVLKMCPLTLEGPLWGRVLSCGIIFIFSFTDVTYTYGLAFKRDFIKPAFLFCLPLVITGFFQWILSYSDRYIIKPLLFDDKLAIYDLAVRFTLLVNFLIDGLNSAISPKVFALLHQEQSENIKAQINRYYSSFNLVVLLIVPLNILLLPAFLPLFIGSEKYLYAFLYFGIICSGFATRGILNVFMYPIYHHQNTGRLIWVNFFSALLQLGISYILIVKFGLYGAALTLVAVKVLFVLLLYIFSKNIPIHKFNLYKMLVLPLIVMVVIVVSEMFINQYGPRMHVIHALSVLLIYGFIYYIYKTEITSLLIWLKRKISSSL